MRKLLWVGDAACESGFAKCTHNTLEALRKTWDVTVLGLNYRGDPHDWPYPIYPCWPGGDMFGVKRIKAIVEKVQPDLIVIQNDPWNFPAYLKQLETFIIPIVGAVAVDGKNCRGTALNGLARAIFWTEFAQREATAGGMNIPSGVVPLGVDLDVYKPGDAAQARNELGLPDDVKAGFIVGNVNRNQPRKRMDLTIRIFGEWIRRYGIQDAFLYLHVAPTGDMGYNCEYLARYYGFNTGPDSRLILCEPEMYHGTPESWVARTMRSLDVGLLTPLGEGWGLTAMEMMACGKPVIGPRHSAFEEWAAGAMCLIDCCSWEANPVAVVGGVIDEEKAIQALHQMYKFRQTREMYGEAGLTKVSLPQYRWEHIAAAFADQVELAWQGQSSTA